MHSIMHKTKLFQSSHVRDDNNMSEVNQKIKYLHSKFTNKNCVVVTKSPTNKQLEIEFESCSSSVVMMMMTRKKCHVQTCMCLQNIQCLNFIKALHKCLPSTLNKSFTLKIMEMGCGETSSFLHR